MKSYETYGDLERVTYEDGIIVEVNAKTDKYSVTLDDGLLIAKDYTTFAPINKYLFLACSLDGGIINFRIPNDWEHIERIKVFEINEEGSLKKIECRLNGRYLEFNTESDKPYKVIYE